MPSLLLSFLLLWCASSSAYTIDFFTDARCTQPSVWGSAGLPPSGIATYGLCLPFVGTGGALVLSLQSCSDDGSAIVNVYPFNPTLLWVPPSCSGDQQLGNATFLGNGQCVPIVYSSLMKGTAPLWAKPRLGFTKCTTPQKWLYHVGTLPSLTGIPSANPIPTDWIAGNTIAVPGPCLSYNETYKFNIVPGLGSTITAKIWNGAQDCLNSNSVAAYTAPVTTATPPLPIVLNGVAPTGKALILLPPGSVIGNGVPGVSLSIFAPETAYVTNTSWQFNLTSYSDQACGTKPAFTIIMGFTKHCASSGSTLTSFWRSVNITDGTVFIIKMNNFCTAPAAGINSQYGTGQIFDLSGRCTLVTSNSWGFGSMRATIITPIPTSSTANTTANTSSSTATPLPTPTSSTTPMVAESSTSTVSVSSSQTIGTSLSQTPTPPGGIVLQSPTSTPLSTPSITSSQTSSQTSSLTYGASSSATPTTTRTALSTPTQSRTPSSSPTATLSIGASPSMTTAGAAGSGVVVGALSPGGAAGVSIAVILLVATGAVCGIVTIRRVNSKFPGSNKPSAMMSSHPVFSPPVQVYSVAVPNPLALSQQQQQPVVHMMPQNIPQPPPASSVYILPSVTVVNAVSYPPPPMPVNFTPTPTLLPQGWTQFSDETDTWYTDANGTSHWELPGASVSSTSV